MELADFFAIDRLSQHDEELLIESAMQMQQMMMLYESGIREILQDWAKSVTRDLSDEERILLITLLDRLIHTDVE